MTMENNFVDCADLDSIGSSTSPSTETSSGSKHSPVSAITRLVLSGFLSMFSSKHKNTLWLTNH